MRALLLQVGLIYATVFQLGLNTVKASPFPGYSVSVGIAGFAFSSALKVSLGLCMVPNGLHQEAYACYQLHCVVFTAISCPALFSLLSAALCNLPALLTACQSRPSMGPLPCNASPAMAILCVRHAGARTPCDPYWCHRGRLDLGCKPSLASSKDGRLALCI